jgi:8-oxo-dGTP diphosphatase
MNAPDEKHIHVVGAVILRNGLVLCAQRGMTGSLPGLWEFPGGKIELGESKIDALQREIAEELGCGIAVEDEITTTVHEYEFGVVHLTTFLCRLTEGEPVLSEHAEFRWVEPANLGSLDWAPADIPAVQLTCTKLR